jgi:hypothetical protein
MLSQYYRYSFLQSQAVTGVALGNHRTAPPGNTVFHRYRSQELLQEVVGLEVVGLEVVGLEVVQVEVVQVEVVQVEVVQVEVAEVQVVDKECCRGTSGN